MTALESDVGDIQGGTTQGSIHMGMMAGTLDLIQRGYVGAELRGGTLYFSPKLNDRLVGLSLPMRFRKMSVETAAYTTVAWEGPESPKTAEDLTTMTADDIVTYLETWRPPGDFMGSSPDGLARELVGVVAQDPQRFAQASSRFRGLDPTYVRGLINGLREPLQSRDVPSLGPRFWTCACGL